MKKSIRSLVFLSLILSLCLSLFSCGNSDSEKEAAYAGDGAKYYKTSESYSNGTEQAAEERKVIKNFSVDTETKEFDAKLQTVETLLGEFGGYVESSHVAAATSYSSNASVARRASYELAVPAEKAEEFVSRLGGELHVISSSSSAKDVSDTYYSAQARLEELIAERDSLLNMMNSLDKSTDYNFWLTLQERISSVRQDIAVLQGQLQNIDSQVAYSTVSLSVQEVIDYTVVEEETFFKRFGDSFAEGWSDFFENLLDFLVWFVGAIPTLLVLTGVGFAIYAIVRKIIKKNTAKRKQRILQMQQQAETNQPESKP